MPIRGVRRMCATRSGGASEKRGGSRRAPLSAPVSPSACVSRPGPEQSSLSATGPRRDRISSSPCVGSSARSRTAAPCPGAPQTMFRTSGSRTSGRRRGGRRGRTSRRSALAGRRTSGWRDRSPRRPPPRRSAHRPRRRGASSRSARARRRGRCPPASSWNVTRPLRRAAAGGSTPAPRLRRVRPPLGSTSSSISSRIVCCVREATMGSGMPSTQTSVRRPFPRSCP